MKYLKKFNESNSYDFPNAEETVKKIDYFISQMSDYEEYDLIRKETFDLNHLTEGIPYYYRVFPNDLPSGIPQTDSFKKTIPARIELTIYTNERDKLKSLYKDLEFLPHALKMEDLYAKVDYLESKDVGNDYIVFTIFDTEKELELWEEKSRFSRKDRKNN